MLYAQSFSCVQLFAVPWTIACQAPLSMGLSRQEYWSGLPCLPPGDLPDLGSNLGLLCLLHWQADSSPLHHLRSRYATQIYSDFLLSANAFIVRCQEEEWDNHPVILSPFYTLKREHPRASLSSAQLWLPRKSQTGSPSPGPLAMEIISTSTSFAQWGTRKDIFTFISPCLSSQEKESNSRWQPATWGPCFFAGWR